MPSFSHWLRLSRDYTIVSAGENAPATLKENVGRNLWEAFAGAEEVYADIYKAAWENGSNSAIVRYVGNIVSLHVIRDNDELLVAVEYLTVQGLEDAIEAMHDALDATPQHECSARPLAV